MQITQGILVLLCTNFPNPLVPVFSSGQKFQFPGIGMRILELAFSTWIP
jgi:hypothetical protein